MFSTLEFILAVHIGFFFQSQKLEDKRIDQLTTNHWLASLLRYILFSMILTETLTMDH